jgi:quinol-cytochrome oxidoreductase complex cytochrome b subunit
VSEEGVQEEAAEEPKQYKRPFLPNHVIDEIGVVFLITGIILIAASLRRPEPFGIPNVFFAGVLEMVDLVSPLFGAIVVFGVVILLLAIPFLDRSEERHPRKRLVFVMLILALIAFFAAFTIMGMT